MIRRGFWLMTGAVVGVAGYRKASKLGRMLTGQQPAAQVIRSAGQIAAVPRRPAAGAAAGSPWPARIATGGRTLAAGTRSAAGFVRDVRDGMAEYHATHDEQSLDGYGGYATDESVPAASIAEDGGGAARGSGLQNERLGRSLQSQRARARPGASPRGPREP